MMRVSPDMGGAAMRQNEDTWSGGGGARSDEEREDNENDRALPHSSALIACPARGAGQLHRGRTAHRSPRARAAAVLHRKGATAGVV